MTRARYIVTRHVGMFTTASATKAGAAGGKQRNRTLTPKRRAEIARKAAAARWARTPRRES